VSVDTQYQRHLFASASAEQAMDYAAAK
jgi:hypothetical protein